MMGRVVVLPGVVVQSDEPRQNVISLIKDLLAEAESGKIQTFAAVTVDAAGFVGTAFSTSGQPHAHHLVAGALYLLRRCENNAVLES